MSQNIPKQAKQRGSAGFFLRVVCGFVLMGFLIVLLHWLGYNVYPDVAEWVEPGDHSALIYEEETYYLAGKIGKKGLTKSKYTADKVLGQVKNDGTPVTTEPVTTSIPETTADPEWEDDEFFEDIYEETETELQSVVPPAGAELFEKTGHAFILYSIEDKPEFLILLAEDGEQYLYYREGTENPVASD
jgi:hypothetical protein